MSGTVDTLLRVVTAFRTLIVPKFTQIGCISMPGNRQGILDLVCYSPRKVSRVSVFSITFVQLELL